MKRLRVKKGEGLLQQIDQSNVHVYTSTTADAIYMLLNNLTTVRRKYVIWTGAEGHRIFNEALYEEADRRFGTFNELPVVDNKDIPPFNTFLIRK